MRQIIMALLLIVLSVGYSHSHIGTYVYTQDIGGRARGMAFYRADDFAVALRYSGMRQIRWYHHAPVPPDSFDCMDYIWNCPIHPGEQVPIADNWGLGIDTDGNIYLANHDDSTSVLVWDYFCQEVDRLELGTQHTTTEYPTALDVDANGYVYVAWYIDSEWRDQIEVYPPRSQWIAHKASLVTSFEPGAYACEGMCVNDSGTVIWVADRSMPGSLGWVKRFVGSPQTGYSEDPNFSLQAEGYIRGMDVGCHVPHTLFVCKDSYSSEGVLVADPKTGTIWDIIPTEIGTYHTSPFDVEYDPRCPGSLYVLHQYGWYVDKWFGFNPSVEMSSFVAVGAEGHVELTWRAESEVNNAGYRLFREGDPIAFVEGRGSSETPLTYTWIDKDVTAGTTYRYRIADVDLGGSETMQDFIAEATPKPAASGQGAITYTLYHTYPNPFNADTQIQFSLAQAGYTTLKIYNTTGQLVRTLVDGHLDARMHRVRWDGRNSSSELVASGIYFYRLSSGNFTETKKMSFLR